MTRSITLIRWLLENLKLGSEELEKLLGLNIVARKDSGLTLRINLLVSEDPATAEKATKKAADALKDNNLEVFSVAGGAVVGGKKGTKIILQGSKEKRPRGRPKKQAVAEPKSGLDSLVPSSFSTKAQPFELDKRGEIKPGSVEKLLSGTTAKFEVERVKPKSVSVIFEPITISATSETDAENKVEAMARPLVDRVTNAGLVGQLVDIDIEMVSRGQFKVKVILFVSALKRESSFDWDGADGILSELSSLLSLSGPDPLGAIDTKVREKLQKRVMAKHLMRRVYKRRSDRRHKRLSKSVPRVS